MEKTKKLIIVGAGELGEMAYEYFQTDSPYEVIAFAVERRYIKNDELYGLPIVAFEEIEKLYPSNQYEVFVAVTYVNLNRERKRLFDICKEKGYKCASYKSSKAFFGIDSSIGENSMILEDNTIQRKVVVGNNVIMWSGNHVGHRSVIGDDCWITSHVVISGFCTIGSGCFIGVNASVADETTIGSNNVIGMASVVTKDILEEGQVYYGSPARKSGKSAFEQF